MRWLMIGLLVSLSGLLIVAAGVARHIWVQHAKLRQKSSSTGSNAVDLAATPVEEPNRETEI